MIVNRHNLAFTLHKKIQEITSKLIDVKINIS